MSILIGIDPGINGGIAVVSHGIANGIDLPRLGQHDLDLDALQEWLTHECSIRHGNVPMVILEKAHAMPKQGVVSVFNYGKVYGELWALCIIRGYRIHEVSPRVWKGKMGLRSKDKDDARRMAIQLFPEVDLKLKKDHHRAEALLLAEYGRRFVL